MEEHVHRLPWDAVNGARLMGLAPTVTRDGTPPDDPSLETGNPTPPL